MVFDGARAAQLPWAPRRGHVLRSSARRRALTRALARALAAALALPLASTAAYAGHIRRRRVYRL